MRQFGWIWRESGEGAEIATRRFWNDGADLNDGIGNDDGARGGGEAKVLFLGFARRSIDARASRTGDGKLVFGRGKFVLPMPKTSRNGSRPNPDEEDASAAPALS